MRVCWFGLELDLTLTLPSLQFYLGPTTVDDDPDVTDVTDPRGDITCYPIGFAPTPHPGWEKSLNGWDEPADDQEDV